MQHVDSVETTAHKDHVEQQHQVGQQAVDAEHHKDDGIVAREVGQVVIDSALGFTEVGRLGKALDIEELGNGAQVGEACTQRGAAEVVEAITKTRSDRINWNRDHFE